jgi:hypothetical protein
MGSLIPSLKKETPHSDVGRYSWGNAKTGHHFQEDPPPVLTPVLTLIPALVAFFIVIPRGS